MTATVEAVPVFDYRRQHAALRDDIEAAVRRVFESGRLILGPEVRAFEEAFTRYLGGNGHGVGVGNGTDALALALRAVGVGPGDEVITVSNTAIPTVSAVRMAGATPVFVDVRADTALMDVEQVEARITERTRAVIPVHLFGNVVDMDALLEVSRRHGLKVVEDCAQSAGASWKGRATGSLGDVGCFSFYPTKNLGAYGDGGFCFTPDAETAERLRRLRFYGCAETYHAVEEGVNSRLDEVQAAILGVKLKRLDGWVARRREIAALYDRHLTSAVDRTPAAPGAEHAVHLYVVKTDRRDALRERLEDAHVGSAVHYPTPIHRMAGYAFLGYGPGSLPVTERLAERVVTLPCFPELEEESVLRVTGVVNDALA